ncbi:UDP-N-acetylglucosamine 2-epimerase [Eubacteriaceae bacterium ES2]|nr:UDP-N-acetylglucosamine 2-epimerase [Eubacteriaceae bacterium ES2]
MKKLCILTATRAEYGLLKRLILQLQKEIDLDVRIAVTGAHLSPEFGLTYREIENDGFEIDTKIEMLLSSDSPAAISKSMGLAMIGFADYFERLEPDLLIVLGDRYETLAVCCAAMNQRIPIAHLYGGEATEGLIDEAIRHAITKMSYLHFTSTESYRRRVIQLGESPNRVFNVGSLGVENVLNEELLSKSELEQSIDWELVKPYAIVTFHPVTLEKVTSKDQVQELLCALQLNSQYQYIITKSNADSDGRIINQLIDDFSEKNVNVKAFFSLGMKRYLSAVKFASFVIGNSSSGVIEVPSFGIPTINIGDRQNGRIQANSVLNCSADCGEINKIIQRAGSRSFINAIDNNNPYFRGLASREISEVIKKFLNEEKIDLKKTFYDL